MGSFIGSPGGAVIKHGVPLRARVGPLTRRERSGIAPSRKENLQALLKYPIQK